MAMKRIQEKNQISAGIWFHADKGILDMDALKCIKDRERKESERKAQAKERAEKEARVTHTNCLAVIEAKGLDHASWNCKQLKDVIKYIRPLDAPKLPMK